MFAEGKLGTPAGLSAGHVAEGELGTPARLNAGALTWICRDFEIGEIKAAEPTDSCRWVQEIRQIAKVITDSGEVMSRFGARRRRFEAAVILQIVASRIVAQGFLSSHPTQSSAAGCRAGRRTFRYCHRSGFHRSWFGSEPLRLCDSHTEPASAPSRSEILCAKRGLNVCENPALIPSGSSIPFIRYWISACSPRM